MTCATPQGEQRRLRRRLLPHRLWPKTRSSTTRSSTKRSPASSLTPRVLFSTLLRHWTRTWMRLRSASYSLKYTEITPIDAVRKVCLSVRRHFLSRPIERRNLRKRVTSISFLVSETCTVLTISFLQSLKVKEWSMEWGNLWKRSLELLRSGKSLVHRSGLCTMNQDERSSQNVARKFLITNSKQARAEQDRQILQEELWCQQKDFREVHQQNLTEMEEVRKFQSSIFDTLTRHKFIEDQNTITELSGRLQELQNEVNCQNVSKEFQDAESVRSGNSHVTSQPMWFSKHPAFEGLLRPPFVPRREEGPPDIWEKFGVSGNVIFFVNPQASSSAPYP